MSGIFRVADVKYSGLGITSIARLDTVSNVLHKSLDIEQPLSYDDSTDKGKIYHFSNHAYIGMTGGAFKITKRRSYIDKTGESWAEDFTTTGFSLPYSPANLENLENTTNSHSMIWLNKKFMSDISLVYGAIFDFSLTPASNIDNGLGIVILNSTTGISNWMENDLNTWESTINGISLGKRDLFIKFYRDGLNKKWLVTKLANPNNTTGSFIEKIESPFISPATDPWGGRIELRFSWNRYAVSFLAARDLGYGSGRADPSSSKFTNTVTTDVGDYGSNGNSPLNGNSKGVLQKHNTLIGFLVPGNSTLTINSAKSGSSNLTDVDSEPNIINYY